MIKAVMLILIFLFTAPILTGVHELGHAMEPLVKGQSVLISVGQSYLVEFKVGRLEVKMGWLKPWVGYAEWSGKNTILSLVLGPVFSLLLALTLLFVTRFLAPIESFLYACAGWCLFQFFMTIFPMNYPSWLGYGDQSSDGVKIIDLLKK